MAHGALNLVCILRNKAAMPPNPTVTILILSRHLTFNLCRGGRVGLGSFFYFSSSRVLFVLTTPGMPVVALLPQGSLSQGLAQGIPGLRPKRHSTALPLVPSGGSPWQWPTGHSLLGEAPFSQNLVGPCFLSFPMLPKKASFLFFFFGGGGKQEAQTSQMNPRKPR